MIELTYKDVYLDPVTKRKAITHESIMVESNNPKVTYEEMGTIMLMHYCKNPKDAKSPRYVRVLDRSVWSIEMLKSNCEPLAMHCFDTQELT